MSFVRNSKIDEEVSIASLIIGATALSHILIMETDAALLLLSTALFIVPLAMGTIRKSLIGCSIAAEVVGMISIAVPLAFGNLELAAGIAFTAAVGITAFKYAVNHKNSGVRTIVDMIPYKLRVETEDGQKAVPIGDVKPGDVIRVNTGECIPFDGTIVRGSVHMDSSVLNGRKGTTFCSEGDTVLGGTINRFGYFSMKVESVGTKTAIYKMSRLIDRMNTVGTGFSRLADNLSGIAMVCAALIGGASFAVAGMPAAVFAFAVTGIGLSAAGIAFMYLTGKLEPGNAESRFMKNDCQTN